jgi:WD40 repeat protein/predicted Ser/Thr protein kinase
MSGKNEPGNEEGGSTPSERSRRLREALTGHLMARDRGEVVDLEDLIRRYPDLEEDIRAFIADDELLRRVAPKGEAGGGSSGRRVLSSLTGSLPRIFAGHELLEVVATGGMGVVYRARQLRPERIVALKMVLGGVFAAPRDLERFLVETEAAARIEHPHIVPIYDVGEEDGVHYYTMRFIEGASLAEEVPRFLGKPKAAAAIVEVVAGAVQYAHERGILHRDLKPGNILIDREGRPYVTDFGLAKILESKNDLTQSGDMVGTLKYMAPEQASPGSVPLTERVDVFSLGVILYQLLSGRAPFDGGSSAETLRRLLNESPPPLERRGTRIPRDLRTITLHALEKEPARRYATAAALAEDLGAFLRGEPLPHARPAGLLEQMWKWIRRRPTAAALVAVIIGAFFVLMGVSLNYNFKLGAEAERAKKGERDAVARAGIAERYLYAARMNLAYQAWQREDVDTAADTVFTIRDTAKVLGSFEWNYLFRLCAPPGRIDCWDGYAPVTSFALSTDGTLLVPNRQNDVVAAWGGDRWRERTEFAGLSYPIVSLTVSRDGTLVIAADERGSIRIVERLTGKEIKRLEGADPRLLSLSPSGALLAAACRKGVRLWETATWRDLGAFGAEWGPIRSIAFSPDERQIAIVGQDGILRLVDVSSQAEIARDQTGAPVRAVAFSPRGGTLASAEGDGSVRLWESAPLRPLRILDQHRSEATAVAFSPDGKIVASGGKDGYLMLWDLEANYPLFSIKAHNPSVVAVEFTSDGKFVVSGGDTSVHFWELAILKEAFVQPLALPGHGAAVVMSSFFDNGEGFYTVSQDFVLKFWKVDPCLWGPRILEQDRIAWEEGGYTSGAVSADASMAATGNAAGEIRVWRILRNEAPPRRELETLLRSEGSIQGLGLSKDGRLLASAEEKAVTIWSRGKQAEGSSWVKERQIPVPFPPRELLFSPDPQSLAMARESERHLLVWDLERAHLAKAPLGDNILALAWSPDSKRVIAGLRDLNAEVLEMHCGTDGGHLQRLATLRHHLRPVTAVCFSPDGKLVLTGTQEGAIYMWDLVDTPEGMTPVRRGDLTGHATAVNCLSFSPDAMLLISGGGRNFDIGEVKAWRGRP